MKPPAIIQPAIDIAAVTKRVRSAHVAVQDAERAEDAASKTAAEKREAAARARLDLGRALVEARKAWPARGPKAKGWGDFLRDAGIEQQRAWDYMRLAGYVEQVSPSDQDDGETVPTYREAGIDRRERASNAPTDEQRETAYRRETESGLPPSMAEREQATHELVGFVSEARSKLREITARNVHLISVTTSPEDFMRAKQMLIDIVNLCLDELAQAGVLDGKEQRRQMRLLDGGVQ